MILNSIWTLLIKVDNDVFAKFRFNIPFNFKGWFAKLSRGAALEYKIRGLTLQMKFTNSHQNKKQG